MYVDAGSKPHLYFEAGINVANVATPDVGTSRVQQRISCAARQTARLHSSAETVRLKWFKPLCQQRDTGRFSCFSG
jgi:hypothetical protein